MKPKELADSLVDIVAINSESSVMWRRDELTDEELLAIGISIERFNKRMLREWQERRAQQTGGSSCPKS